MIKDKTILIKNIYYMLSYAFTPLTQGGYENVEKEEFENIHMSVGTGGYAAYDRQRRIQACDIH